MKEFLARLNPTERRFVVGVAVVFFLVINIVWVFPHFGDWSETKNRMNIASTNLFLFEGGAKLIPDLKIQIEKYTKQGVVVPAADQAVHFVRLIQTEEAKVGIMHQSMTPVRTTSTTNNQYFLEQGENMVLQTTEKPLVNFLYNLGSGDSLIRVRSLSLTPDPSHQQLSTRVTLVASYQKKAVGSASTTSTPAAGAKPAAAAPKGPAPTQTPAAKPAPPKTTPTTTKTGPAATTNTQTARPLTGPRPLGSTNRMLPGAPPAPRNLTPTNK